MDQQLLTMDKVLAGFDAVSQLYPYVPSLCLWRAWEYTAYRHHTLPEPVLDIGCGDGRFFKLIWPQLSNVVGLDIDTDIVKIAQKSGVYKEVIIAPANQLPVPVQSFASVFANCSLEHMDYLPKVLN